MRRYIDQTGRSGVEAFETGEESIVIKFKRDGFYLYNYQRPGESHVEEMKRLAENGQGLSTYISQKVGKNYFKKLS